MTEKVIKRPGRGRSTEVITVRALERGLQVLDYVATTDSGTLSEIARATSLVPSTAYRILETLAGKGYVTYLPQAGVYQLGLRVYELGNSLSTYDRLKQAARPQMKRLVRETTEGVNLAVLDRKEVVYIQHEEGTGMMRMFTREGGRAPPYCTGVGKCLLAWLPEDAWPDHLPESPFASFTPYTITDRDAFYQELRQVRAAGMAMDKEEREEGVTCVTVPVWGDGGNVVAALSVSGPTTRMERQDLPEFQKNLERASRQISSLIQSKDIPYDES